MPWVRSPPPACPRPIRSVDDAVPDVRHGGGLDDARHLERRPFAAEPLEQSHAVSEEKRSDCIWTSSMSPSLKYCCATSAPPETWTFLSPAAARACASA